MARCRGRLLAPGYRYPCDPFSSKLRSNLGRQARKMPEELGTWTAGLCLILACALNRAFGWPMGVVRDGAGQPQHYFSRRPDGKLVDFDGAQSRDFMLGKMRDVESVQNPSLDRFQKSDLQRAKGREDLLGAGWDYCDNSGRLVRSLRRTFPEYASNRGWCCEGG